MPSIETRLETSYNLYGKPCATCKGKCEAYGDDQLLCFNHKCKAGKLNIQLDASNSLKD